MPTLTVNLAQPIAGVRLVQLHDQECAGAAPARFADEPASVAGVLPADRGRGALGTAEETERQTREVEQQKAQLAHLCRTVGHIAADLKRLHHETLAHHRTEIARLAVEIARRVLMHKTDRGDYDIQVIVEEALKQAPTRQDITIRLNPDDLPRCQQLQQENPENPFAELKFSADWSIGRGACLVETPKGIVRSFVEEHLERISEALQRVQ